LRNRGKLAASSLQFLSLALNRVTATGARALGKTLATRPGRLSGGSSAVQVTADRIVLLAGDRSLTF
jgi:hypothetical protein